MYVSATACRRPIRGAAPIPDGMRFSPWIGGDGHALRSFLFAPPGPPRGSLLFLGGRGDFAEKYIEAMTHWRQRGWRVSASTGAARAARAGYWRTR